MEVFIDIQEKLSDQFISYLDMRLIDGEHRMNPSIGSGSMRFIEFPSKLEFYHFKKCIYKQPIYMKTVNAIDTDWFIFHINLSNTKQVKQTAGKSIEFHRHSPIGVIIYGAGIEIETRFEAKQEAELASFRFHKDFLKFYFDDKLVIEDKASFEDLDYQLEELLRQALLNMDDKLVCHKYVLEFLDLFIKKLQRRSGQSDKTNLHGQDIKGLFQASALLRNPSASNLPSIVELAAIANMSVSKFKKSFKQLFAVSPIQFHHKIRMEYARDELLNRRKSPTDLSYEFGYSHPSNFTTAFKKHFNQLPSSLG